MKRILTLIAAFSILLTACEGDTGPPGPQGPDGVSLVGQSFERTFDIEAPDYIETIGIPENIDLIESDMVLVYHLVGVDDDGFDIWRLLPDTVFTNDGQQFQYNFQHRFDLVDIFIEAPSTFDFNSLLPGDILDQTFRIVILPIDFINSIDLNLNDFNAVMEHVSLN
ncbi:dihydrolipoamide dehydrogenase [Winogradskyella immobilis]|uniref:Dihydrolipoamide dehydrogenase n=1 Tax=Winogradskyella immobilis TaxID=2816852 RepID=A0ABS8ELG0_9FLAO|nr:dihydrolipoamide dehydrogenase [Winogradskyella immobilis]MCC1483682.1 dihydrolipoamide dehydrogenase [Winogradskyella immobilis]MCG0015776.1 dihydrolipoamide dehydrogenase [Winogradskyella immobilis]